MHHRGRKFKPKHRHLQEKLHRVDVWTVTHEVHSLQAAFAVTRLSCTGESIFPLLTVLTMNVFCPLNRNKHLPPLTVPTLQWKWNHTQALFVLLECGRGFSLNGTAIFKLFGNQNVQTAFDHSSWHYVSAVPKSSVFLCHSGIFLSLQILFLSPESFWGAISIFTHSPS